MITKAKLKKIRQDVRLGLTTEELSKKHNISYCSARNYRTNYRKALKKQKEMGLYA
ncbi:hypothetical protein [Tepidibacter mesophilus]|uniref:hypothetical protein n=1 Tax=Tepidibacter mesophilus TaxID=655607 RepID=UPI0016510C45|nr:hypothetical protein [Tepidibacter mesophilus]